MKYFLDTEFHEFKKKPLFSKGVDTIELISIGIVSEDGREYYAISKDFDLKTAWNNEWLRNNVLINIHYELSIYECSHKLKFDKWKELISMRNGYSKRHFKTLKKLLDTWGYTNKQIAEEVKDFISQKDQLYFKGCNLITYGCTQELLSSYEGRMICIEKNFKLPEFYGYYADYDWVVFCWLFGRMIDLPKGFPMMCFDLKQILDEKIMEKTLSVSKALNDGVYPVSYKDQKPTTIQFEEMLKEYKNSKEYPKQTNEHNALADAKWNYELYKFLQTI